MSLVQAGEYDKTASLIVGIVPEFAESPEFARLVPGDRTLPGVVAGAFTDFLIRLQSAVLAGQAPTASLDRSYAAVERLARSSDPQVRNLVVTEIFENLESEPAVIARIRDSLRPESLMLFTVWIEGRGH